MNLLRACLGMVRDKIWDPELRHQRKLAAVSTEPIPVSIFPTVVANKKASGILKYEVEVGSPQLAASILFLFFSTASF